MSHRKRQPATTRHFSNHSIRFLFVTICNFLRLRLYLQPSIRIHVLFHSFPKYTFFIKMEKIKRATWMALEGNWKIITDANCSQLIWVLNWKENECTLWKMNYRLPVWVPKLIQYWVFPDKTAAGLQSFFQFCILFKNGFHIFANSLFVNKFSKSLQMFSWKKFYMLRTENTATHVLR